MGFITNAQNNKSANGIVFAKRKPAFKVRIDSLRNRPLPNKPPRKSVRFADNRNTVLFRHVMDSELKQTWYESKDYSDFKKDSRGTINALQQAHGQLCHLDPQQHCIRGLEAHVNDSILMLRQTRIRTNVQVVLDQQRSQKFHGIKDTNMLGAVSMMFSKQSRQVALSMGALDSTMRGC